MTDLIEKTNLLLGVANKADDLQGEEKSTQEETGQHREQEDGVECMVKKMHRLDGVPVELVPVFLRRPIRSNPMTRAENKKHMDAKQNRKQSKGRQRVRRRS